jgi:hypothetical protein
MYMNNPQRYGREVQPSPVIVTPPQSASVTAGGSATLGVTATGATSYQWYFNGSALAGATGPSLTLSDVGVTQAGSYTVAATNASGVTTISSAAILTVTYSARLINLSVLSDLQSSVSMGFVIGGAGTSGSETLLIRGIGPALSGIVGPDLADPVLTVVQRSNGATVAKNSGWGTPSSNIALVTAADDATGAFALTNSASKDAAVVASLPIITAGYSAVVAGAAGDGGYALTEVYDDTANYTAASARLVNLSCETQVTAGGTLTVGFVVEGSTSETILVRATGPALALLGVAGTMPDPQLSVQPLNPSQYPAAPTASNAGWAGNAQITSADSLAGAFALTSPTSKDSALVITVPPGVPYTVQVSSVSGTAGTVLAEIYEVP